MKLWTVWISRLAARSAFVLCLAGLSGISIATPKGTLGDLLLINGTIVDTERQALRQGAILINQGMVKAVLDKVPNHFDGEVIDLEGRWIIPGLIDMHVMPLETGHLTLPTILPAWNVSRSVCCTPG